VEGKKEKGKKRKNLKKILHSLSQFFYLGGSGIRFKKFQCLPLGASDLYIYRQLGTNERTLNLPSPKNPKKEKKGLK